MKLDKTHMPTPIHSPPSSARASPTPNADAYVVKCQVRARIPTPHGVMYLHVYTNNHDTKQHLALVFGDSIHSRSLNQLRSGETIEDRRIRGASESQANTKPDLLQVPLVRIHSECFTGETLSSVRCDCGAQLSEAVRRMDKEGLGVVIYLRQEGRNIGLIDKLKAYNLQDMGLNTVEANLRLSHPADARDYSPAIAILNDLQLHSIRLLTNNPEKLLQVEDNGVHVVKREEMIPKWWSSEDSSPFLQTWDIIKKELMAEADEYLRVKAEQMGHILPLPPRLRK